MQVVARSLVATVIAAITLVSGSSAQDKPVRGPSPLNDEQLSVYRGFLERMSALHFNSLANMTVPFDFKGFPDGRPCLRGIELENTSAALRTTHSFGREIAASFDLTLVDAVAQKELRQRRDASSNSGNEKSTDDDQAVNSQLNYLVLSEIAFDTKHQFAVLKYLLVCGEHCVSGATLMMEKVEGKWTTSSRRPCALFVGN
jgi:hypothetical protein